MREVEKIKQMVDLFDGNYISISEAAIILGVSYETIKRWYKWYASEFEHPEDLVLPKYYIMDRRKTKYFKKEDIMVLAEFGKKINTTHIGVMSEFNAAYQWGKRGEKTLSNKGVNSKDVKFKFK